MCRHAASVPQLACSRSGILLSIVSSSLLNTHAICIRVALNIVHLWFSVKTTKYFSLLQYMQLSANNQAISLLLL